MDQVNAFLKLYGMDYPPIPRVDANEKLTEWIKEAKETNEILSLTQTREIVTGLALGTVLKLLQDGLICPEAINFCHLFAHYKGQPSTSTARYFQYNVPRPLVVFTNVLLEHSGPGILAYSGEYTVLRKLTNRFIFCSLSQNVIQHKYVICTVYT